MSESNAKEGELASLNEYQADTDFDPPRKRAAAAAAKNKNKNKNEKKKNCGKIGSDVATSVKLAQK